MKKILHKIYSHHHHHHHRTHDVDGVKKGTTKPQHIESGPLDFLSSAHLEEANGFHLKSKDESPTSLEIKPTHGMGQVSVAISRWKMETSSSAPSSALSPYSVPAPWTKLEISVALVQHSKTGEQLGEDEVIAFRQRTNRDSSMFPGRGRNNGIGPKDSSFVDVYCSHKSVELLGWIKYGPDQCHYSSKSDFDDGWVINDLISKSVFLTSPLDLGSENLKFSSSPEITLGMRISTVEDLTVAVLQTKRGMRQRRTGQVSWTDWKVQFTPEFSSTLPTSSKAIILVASIIWVLNSREQERYSRRALSVRQNSAE